MVRENLLRKEANQTLVKCISMSREASLDNLGSTVVDDFFPKK